jgi:hypothetical protein
MLFIEKFSCIEYNDWLIILMNVLFFIIIQTLFFRYIASKQYDNVLVSKLDIIKLFLEKNKNLQILMDNRIDSYIEKNKETVSKQRKARYLENKRLESIYCWDFVKMFGLVFYLVLIMGASRREWTGVHTLGTIIILLSYSTELMFFFGIVKQYEFVGDHYIYSKLLEPKAA